MTEAVNVRAPTGRATGFSRSQPVVRGLRFFAVLSRSADSFG